MVEDGGGVIPSATPTQEISNVTDIKDLAGGVPADGVQTPEAAKPSGRRFSREQPPAPKFPKRRVANVMEQRVLKMGLSKLNDELAGEAGLKQVSGRVSVMRQSFFNRLLTNEIEFNGAMANDISSAQSDIKHLALEQQLVLRCRTLDFSTESASHNAHNNFLGTLDTQLFEKFARRCFEGREDVNLDAKVLYKLGYKFTLILGATEFLDESPDLVAGDASGSLPPVPECWAIPLDEGECRGCRAVFFNAADVWAQAVMEDQPDFDGLAAGAKVGIVRDRSSGVGKAKSMLWDVNILDPKTENVAAELARSAPKASSKNLSGELVARLSLRQRSPSLEEPRDGDSQSKAASFSSVQSDRVVGTAEQAVAVAGSSSSSWAQPARQPSLVSSSSGQAKSWNVTKKLPKKLTSEGSSSSLKNTSTEAQALATAGGNPWGQHMLKPSAGRDRLGIPASASPLAMGPAAAAASAVPSACDDAGASFGANSSFAPDVPDRSPGLCERICSFGRQRPKERQSEEPFLAC